MPHPTAGVAAAASGATSTLPVPVADPTGHRSRTRRSRRAAPGRRVRAYACSNPLMVCAVAPPALPTADLRRHAMPQAQRPQARARPVRDRKARGASGRGRGVEFAPQVADLVAELGGVLEPQILGRRQHLLLELDDRALELLGGHVRLALAAGAPALVGHLALGHEELRDVGDAL